MSKATVYLMASAEAGDVNLVDPHGDKQSGGPQPIHSLLVSVTVYVKGGDLGGKGDAQIKFTATDASGKPRVASYSVFVRNNPVPPGYPGSAIPEIPVPSGGWSTKAKVEIH